MPSGRQGDRGSHTAPVIVTEALGKRFRSVAALAGVDLSAQGAGRWAMHRRALTVAPPGSTTSAAPRGREPARVDESRRHPGDVLRLVLGTAVVAASGSLAWEARVASGGRRVPARQRPPLGAVATAALSGRRLLADVVAA